MKLPHCQVFGTKGETYSGFNLGPAVGDPSGHGSQCGYKEQQFLGPWD